MTPAIGAVSPHPDRHDLGGKLGLVTEPIGAVSGARKQVPVAAVLGAQHQERAFDDDDENDCPDR